MKEIFYRTYPKKFNSSNPLGFVDIYDLDNRFILIKILGIKNMLIENLFEDNYYFIKNELGDNSDFLDQIEKANKLKLNLYLRIDANNIDIKNLKKLICYWKEKGIAGIFTKNIFDLDDKFLIDENCFRENLDYFEDEFIKNKDREFFLKKYVEKANQNESILALNKSSDFISRYIFNFKNYYTLCAKLLAMIEILRKPSSFIKEGEEFLLSSKNIDKEISKDIFEFYRLLLLIRYKYDDIIEEGYFSFNKKDKDIISYIYYKGKKCIVIMLNLRQRDILLKLPEYLHNSSYILGNISRRKIVDNLTLRPYEGLVFESFIK